MPTRGRRELVRYAVECFHSQTYQNRELVILDDADDPSFPDGLVHPAVRYFREPERFTIPIKRNHVNALARGEVLIHFDSDDWSDPTRMAQQVARLEETGKAVTGYQTLFFYDPETGQSFEYRSKSNYALGTSLCYYKWWWEASKFNEGRPVGSDNYFVYAADRAKQLDPIPGGRMIVARIHADNTSKGKGHGPQFVPVKELPAGFLASMEVTA